MAASVSRTRQAAPKSQGIDLSWPANQGMLALCSKSSITLRFWSGTPKKP